MIFDFYFPIFNFLNSYAFFQAHDEAFNEKNDPFKGSFFFLIIVY